MVVRESIQDVFLTFYQRYLLSKATFPMDVEFEVSDFFELLRPKLVRFTTFEAANQECERLQQVRRAS